MQEGRPCTVPAAASASPTCTAAPAAAWQASAEQEAAQAAAGAPAAPATPTAQRLKPGHSEPAKNPVPAAKDPQEAGARPAPESRDGAESDSDISIGMWDLPPGPPREGLPHVAVKMEENGHIADAEIKLETTTCANPSQVRLRLFSLPDAYSLSTDHVCAGSLLSAVYANTCEAHHHFIVSAFEMSQSLCCL